MAKTDTTKFKSLADYLLGWTWDTRFRSNPLWSQLAVAGPVLEKVDQYGKTMLRKHITEAERFRLSDDFLERTMERAAQRDPSQMLSIAGLAKMPVRRPMLVEFNANVAYRKRVELGTAGALSVETTGRDGFLFLPCVPPYTPLVNADEESWIALHLSDTEGGMPLWPTACRYGSTVGHVNEVPAQYNQFLSSAWGYLSPDRSSGLPYAVHEELIAVGRTALDPYFAAPAHRVLDAVAESGDPRGEDTLDRMWTGMTLAATENSGALRLSCSILAAMNVVPTTRTVHRPSTTFQHRLRTLPHLGVTDVAIDARPGRTKVIYDQSFKTAIHHRLHDVRGHWRDYSRHSAAYCDHQIVETDEVYALCGKCTRLLRWVVPHERGDENLGRVIHDHYTVQ